MKATSTCFSNIIKRTTACRHAGALPRVLARWLGYAFMYGIARPYDSDWTLPMGSAEECASVILNGERRKMCASTIDSALLFAGALTAATYFDCDTELARKNRTAGISAILA